MVCAQRVSPVVCAHRASCGVCPACIIRDVCLACIVSGALGNFFWVATLLWYTLVSLSQFPRLSVSLYLSTLHLSISLFLDTPTHNLHTIIPACEDISCSLRRQRWSPYVFVSCISCPEDGSVSPRYTVIAGTVFLGLLNTRTAANMWVFHTREWLCLNLFNAPVMAVQARVRVPAPGEAGVEPGVCGSVHTRCAQRLRYTAVFCPEGACGSVRFERLAKYRLPPVLRVTSAGHTELTPLHSACVPCGHRDCGVPLQHGGQQQVAHAHR